MSSLIITAHPSSKGFTHQIAKEYKETIEKNNGSAVILDLYDKKNHLDFVQFEDLKDFPKNKTIERFQTLIKNADELVFVFPMWNFTEPAILKNFYDSVFTAGFGFQFEGKMIPKRLLKGKTAKFFVTCDSPSWLFTVIGNPLKMLWRVGRMSFVGIKMKSFTLFDKMRQQSSQDKKKYLEKVKKLALK